MNPETITDLVRKAPSLGREDKFVIHSNLLPKLLEAYELQPETLDKIVDAYQAFADIHKNYTARTLLALSAVDTQYRLILHAADTVKSPDLSKAKPVAEVLEQLSTSFDAQRGELLELFDKQSFQHASNEQKINMMAAYYPIAYDAILIPGAYAGTVLEDPSMKFRFLYASLAHEFYTQINDSAIAISTTGYNSPMEHETKAKIAQGLLTRLENDFSPNIHPDVRNLREFTWLCLANPATS